MIREGWWINYRTGFSFCIGLRGDHERWIQEPGNAVKLGVPKKVIAEFDRYRPGVDREKFLLFVMHNAPVMRCRGHGVYVTFEYSASSDRGAMKAIERWVNGNAGPRTGLNVVNLACITAQKPLSTKKSH